jgi:hypothetical protein
MKPKNKCKKENTYDKPWITILTGGKEPALSQKTGLESHSVHGQYCRQGEGDGWIVSGGKGYFINRPIK